MRRNISSRYRIYLALAIILFLIVLSSVKPVAAQENDNLPPVANLHLDPSKHPIHSSVKVLDQVYFDGGESYDPNIGDVLKYFWSFGDGSTSNSIAPIHIYHQIGEYTVSLTVNDSKLSDKRTMTIIVYTEGGNAPSAKIFIDKDRDENGYYIANVSQTIIFDGSGSFDPDGSQLSYEWDFGDGSTDLKKVALHDYEGDGVYTVVLMVNDDEKLISRDLISIKIGKGGEPGQNNNENPEDNRWELGTIFIVITIFIILLLVLIWFFLGRLRKRALERTKATPMIEDRTHTQDLSKSRARPHTQAPELAKPAVRSQDRASRKMRADRLAANEGKLKQVMLRQKLQEERKKLDDDMKKELEDMGIEL